jgi:hypothetical protein
MPALRTENREQNSHDFRYCRFFQFGHTGLSRITIEITPLQTMLCGTLKCVSLSRT